MKTTLGKTWPEGLKNRTARGLEEYARLRGIRGYTDTPAGKEMLRQAIQRYAPDMKADNPHAYSLLVGLVRRREAKP